MTAQNTVTGHNHPDRIYLEETFLRVPGINADVVTTNNAALVAVTNTDFEVLGLNAASADVTTYAEGGIKLETDGTTTNDAVVILPHLDTAQSAWKTTTWGTDKNTHWGALIKTGSNITAQILWGGLKLTNTETVATDNDQAYWRYKAGENGGAWTFVSSSDATGSVVDTTTVSGIIVAVDTVYRLEVWFDGNLVPHGVVTEVKDGGKAEHIVNPVMSEDEVDLIPYFGVSGSGTQTAEHAYLMKEWISRDPG